MIVLNLLDYELIDTLWNVNADNSEIEEDEEKELIDTLWNLNLFFFLLCVCFILN